MRERTTPRTENHVSRPERILLRQYAKNAPVTRSLYCAGMQKRAGDARGLRRFVLIYRPFNFMPAMDKPEKFGYNEK